MKNFLVVVVTLLSLTGMCFANSIILPFWQDSASPVYSMFVILNTSATTTDTIKVQYYGKTGNPQQGTVIEKTIPAKNLEIFGTNHSPFELKVVTADPYGYAVATETDGMLVAIGIVYDASAHAGYPIPCFAGGADGGASSGW
jgi:hypothetical protein